MPLFVQVFCAEPFKFPILGITLWRKAACSSDSVLEFNGGGTKFFFKYLPFPFQISHTQKPHDRKIFFFSDISRFIWRKVSWKNMHRIITAEYLEQNQKLLIFLLKDKNTRSFSPAYRSTHECLQAPLTWCCVVQRFCRVQYILYLVKGFIIWSFLGPSNKTSILPTSYVSKRKNVEET